jgi:hypothetical protein
MKSKGELLTQVSDQKFLAITYDQDWCHKSVLDWSVNLFLEEVSENRDSKSFMDRASSSKFFGASRLTVFVTDFSLEWVQTPLVEYGAHPNFEASTTQGTSHKDILLRAERSIRDCSSWRAHTLMSSTRISELVARATSWTIENNYYLPDATLLPYCITSFPNDRPILRVPLHWEDDLEMRRGKRATEVLKGIPPTGNHLIVFNFHPIHLALNSVDMSLYEDLRQAGLLGEETSFYLERASSQFGVRDQFLELIEFVKNDNSFKLISLNEVKGLTA